MKYKISFLLFALLATAGTAVAYDFSAEAPTGQTLYYNIDGNNVTVTYPSSNPTYVYNAWSGFPKPTGDLIIPASVTYDGNTYLVTSVDWWAFPDCTGLTSVTIQEGVTNIGARAFDRCTGLTSVTLPSSVTSIGSSAFNHCTGLTSVTMPSSLTSTGNSVFSYCTGLTSVTIPSLVTSIDAGAFMGCTGLTSVTIPSSVTSIGNSAFLDCSGLTSIAIPSSVTSIGLDAFHGCTDLTSVTLPSSVTSIGGGTFNGCTSLISVTIPSSVTSIGSWAFRNCNSLTSIMLPSSVTSMGGDAFEGCTNLTEIISMATLAPMLETGSVISTTATAYIPCGSMASYQSTWGTSCNYSEEIFYTYTVESENEAMGLVEITEVPTCSNNASLGITAQATEGYSFVRWSDDNTDNPRMLTLTQDTTLRAIFEIATYTVTATNAFGGGTYTHGSTAMLMALPQVDGQFAGWSDGETANPRMLVVMSDTTIEALFRALDTVRVYDTTTVYDTVVNMVYDTVINIVYDTTEFHHIIYDTTRVFDTVVLVNIDTLNHYFYQYDTTRVFDTVVLINIDTMNHYFYQYDTTRVFDTVILVNVDTLNHYYYDTTVVTHYVFDSIWLFDSVYVFDTVYIHDTIHITQEGVGGADALNAKVYSSQGQIVVEGAEGNSVWLYDMNGRMIQEIKQSDNQAITFDAPASGTYLIKIGNHAARKVVVIR